jgi:hypothetical protein
MEPKYGFFLFLCFFTTNNVYKYYAYDNAGTLLPHYVNQEPHHHRNLPTSAMRMKGLSPRFSFFFSYAMKTNILFLFRFFYFEDEIISLTAGTERDEEDNNGGPRYRFFYFFLRFFTTNKLFTSTTTMPAVRHLTTSFKNHTIASCQ